MLAPARLLHALSLAYLVAVLVPREAGWMHGRLGEWLAMIGRHSLPVFCFGLYLAWGVNTWARVALALAQAEPPQADTAISLPVPPRLAAE